MKILCYTDVHWSRTSSIVTQQGEKYSLRLEKLIQSVNWAENLAVEHGCDLIVNGGDFFDKSTLMSEEISAMSEIKWATIPHKFVLGNHEIKDKNKEFTSLHLIKLLGFDLITEPQEVDCGTFYICYLPYMFEYPTLDEIFPESVGKRRVIFSHNDIEGVVLGGYTFDNGFSLLDISKNCELFLNGHIHAKGVYGNMVNLGNLCGQNFGENNVPHNAYILDTDTMDLQEFENPYALNFYKINCTEKIRIPHLKDNAVLQIKVSEDTLEQVKKEVEGKENIIDVRYTIIPKKIEETEKQEDVIQIDHLQALQDYIINEIGSTELVKEELDVLVR